MPGPWSRLLCCFCLLTGLTGTVLAQRRLCGQMLADTLDLICADSGFNLAKRNGRSAEALPGHAREFSPLRSFFHHTTKQSGGQGAHVGERSDNLSQDSRLDTHATRRDTLTSSKAEQARSKVRRSRRESPSSIVEECCHRPCSFATLRSYCASPDDPVVILPEEVLRARLGFTTQPPSGSHRATGRRRQTTMRPSAEIYTASGGRRVGSYFYVDIGNQPTRKPLVE